MGFLTPEAEAEYLAKTISSSISNYGLTSRDFILLVKQSLIVRTASDKSFQQYGLKVRVIKEDILAEPLTEIFVSFLRFGSKDRAGIYWSNCYNILTSLRGLDQLMTEMQDYYK
jgi:hypothetical protein